VIVVAVMNGELVEVFTGKFASATPADPGMNLERTFALALRARLSGADGFGDQAVRSRLFVVVQSNSPAVIVSPLYGGSAEKRRASAFPRKRQAGCKARPSKKRPTRGRPSSFAEKIPALRSTSRSSLFGFALPYRAPRRIFSTGTIGEGNRRAAGIQRPARVSMFQKK
jgi:hypothetical protein